MLVFLHQYPFQLVAIQLPEILTSFYFYKNPLRTVRNAFFSLKKQKILLTIYKTILIILELAAFWYMHFHNFNVFNSLQHLFFIKKSWTNNSRNLKNRLHEINTFSHFFSWILFVSFVISEGSFLWDFR